MIELHSLVEAVDEGYGEYIGEVVGLRKHPSPVCFVKILACIKYPSQYALLVKDVHFKREPFTYLHVKIFSINDIKIYKGEIPEYEQSVLASLKESV